MNYLKTNATSQTSNASNLNAKNIYVNTDEKLSTNTNIVGSNVVADENLYINTNNLNVKASQDTSTSSQDSKTINGSVAFTMYGGGGGTAGLGYGQQNSDSNTLINNNSILQGNNVNINASNDAIFQGANLKANDTLNLNVGNNLTLESLRDEYSSNSNGFNVNAGIGFGSAGASANRTPSLDVGKQSSTNAGFSVNNGTILNKQTVLSSITGDKVNVNVGNNTHLKGALLASGNYDENGNFVDNKNLNFNTNTLTFENLSNTSFSSNQSIGGSLNYNLTDTRIVNTEEKKDIEKGISSVKYNSDKFLSVNASKTLATLGEGNITTKDKENSDDLTKLNQDTQNINKDLYSSSTGTKVDAILDTRLLTEEGRKQIAEDVERTKRLGQSISEVLSSDTFNHIDDVQKDLDVQKALALKNDGKTVDIIENQSNYSQTQIDTAINDYAQIYASTYGVNIDIVKMAILNKYGSTYTNEDNINSNICLDKILNQNALTVSNTLGHEVAHVRQNQNQTYLRETTDLQEEYSDIFGKYSSSGLEFSSNTYNNVQLSKIRTNNLNLTSQDVNTLKTNTNLYLQDVSKVNSGYGRIDDRQLSIEEKALQFKQNANDLKEALAQTSNLSKKDIDNIFEMTQKAMVNKMDDYMLNLQLKTTYKDKADEINFVINEAKQYFIEESKGQTYLDKNDLTLKAMMDINNFNDSTYNPSSNSKIVKSTVGSVIRTGVGLVPNPYIAIPAWVLDTSININNNDFSNLSESVQNLSPSIVGNPWANQNFQNIGAVLSIFNTMQSLDNYENKIDILKEKRDTTNSQELQNIYNNSNPIQIKKIETPQLNLIKVNP
jgi:hypothetical protein